MAFTLSTIYKAVDQFSPILKKMERANNSFASRQDKAMRQIGGAMSNMRNQLLGLAGNVSAATLVISGFNAIKDFDESLASLKAITGLTGDAFIPFKNQIKSIGNELQVAYPTISKTMELMASLDATLLNNADDMGKMTRAAILLSKSSGAELPESAQSLTSILKIFGATAKDAGRYVDILSTSEQKGTYTVAQLADGLKTVGGTARVLGMNVDQTAALLQALAPSTKSVEVASTGLNSILNKLGTTTKKQFNPAIVGSAKAIQNLRDANLDLKGAQALVGAQRAGMLLSLINQNKIVQELSDNQYIQNNALKQQEDRERSFTASIGRLISKFKNLSINAGDAGGILNKFGKVIEFVTKHLNKIIAAIGITIGLLVTYYTLMTTLRIATLAYNFALDLYILLSGKSILLMQKQGLVLKAYTAYQWLANTAAWGFTAALLANPMTWIVVGIMALIAAIILLVKHWDKVKKAMSDFFTWAWENIKKFGRLMLDVFLAPIVLALKLMAKLTGSKYAVEQLGEIEKLKDKVYNNDEKPVNIQKTTNEAQTSKYEEITKNKIEVELTNKTDKKANVRSNPALIPILTNTR